MKTIQKKILVTVIILSVTVTLAYAGMKNEKKVYWDEVYNHPALNELAYWL
jgi:hypothetical protein